MKYFSAQTNPGDEVPEGTSQSGDDVCPECIGKGVQPDGQPCANCGGTGKVTKLVGDA
jgi:DnaJ-class molecular chaperone